uniref:G-protein coupled receptors family 1 profile domain-containing protein n=1 Tax=Cyprinus carpio TaxID=7962 RepID=A0A8C2KDG8_CYPCA
YCVMKRHSHFCSHISAWKFIIALYVFIITGITCTVIANFLVVLAIAYFKQLHCPTNSFIMSLAVADFLVGLVVMPYSMVRTVERCWYFGPTFCHIHSSLDVICIAFDHYYAVCNPLVYLFKMSRKRVGLLIVVCWAIPFLISFGPILLGLHKLGMDIYKAAKRQAIKKQKHSNSIRRERKAAKTLGIIMGVFLLFWLPFFTVNIVDPFIEYGTAAVIWDVFLWLGYVNSSLNPFLYGFFNRSFRRAFLMIMGCRICLHGTTQGIDLSNSKRDASEHTDKQ